MSGVESMLIEIYFICLHLRRITDKTFDPIKDINSSHIVDDKYDELAEPPPALLCLVNIQLKRDQIDSRISRFLGNYHCEVTQFFD